MIGGFGFSYSLSFFIMCLSLSCFLSSLYNLERNRYILEKERKEEDSRKEKIQCNVWIHFKNDSNVRSMFAIAKVEENFMVLYIML
jgi:hypothetical protein